MFRMVQYIARSWDCQSMILQGINATRSGKQMFRIPVGSSRAYSRTKLLWYIELYASWPSLTLCDNT